MRRGWDWGRKGVVVAALAVFFVRALVPTGWMPGPGAAGLVPCFGHAVAAPQHHQHMPGHHMPGHEAPKHESAVDVCPFGAMPAAAPAPVIAVPVPARMVSVERALPEVAAAERIVVFAGSPRGPPTPI